MQKTKTKTTGFTLAELLVVIAIVSILACILLPFLRKAIAAARQVDCANRMRQYMIEHAQEWRKRLEGNGIEICRPVIWLHGGVEDGAGG